MTLSGPKRPRNYTALAHQGHTRAYRLYWQLERSDAVSTEPRVGQPWPGSACGSVWPRERGRSDCRDRPHLGVGQTSSKLVGRSSALGSLTIMAATKPPQDAPAPAAVPLSPLLDATEAGRLLSVPASWVLAEARANRIPHVRLGRYVRFSADDLEEWWRARMRGPWRARGAASRTARTLPVDQQAEGGRRLD